MSTTSVSLTTPLIAGSVDFTENLSPDAMIIYLQSRLDGLDEQIDTIFNDQQRQQKVQSILSGLKSKISALDENTTEAKSFDQPPAEGQPASTNPSLKAGILADIEAIKNIDPALAKKITDGLNGPGQLDIDKDDLYVGSEVRASQEFLNGIGKDLESQAAMNMIHLQSLMSSRQTAVQLATNLVASLGETTKAIVTNLR